MLICGVLCGVAGAYLSTALQAGFIKDMSAGRGYIALAALIFAKWRPWYALWATLLFGLFGALETRPDVIEALVNFKVQGQLLAALPYVMTVIILAGFVGKAIPPRAGERTLTLVAPLQIAAAQHPRLISTFRSD